MIAPFPPARFVATVHRVNRLADHVRRSLDMNLIWHCLEALR